MASATTHIIHQPKAKKGYHASDNQKYDFIGDVHGYADELEALLEKLGYTRHRDTWEHPEYKAVFVGDFINRGHHNRRVLDIIQSMVKKGTGYAILGNHEMNAIYYFTKRKNGLPLRLPGPTNKKQLDRLRGEYLNADEEFTQIIKWLRQLPLFIDFGKVRAVHAYWSDRNIELLKDASPNKRLKKKFLKDMLKGDTPVSNAFIQTIKGIEYPFPSNIVVKDNYKVRRFWFRVKWWEDPYNKSFEQLSFETKFHLPDILVPNHLVSPFQVYDRHQPPVFIGHYCTSLSKVLPAPNICCIDTCVANRGHLSAYRWQGESHLSASNIVSTAVAVHEKSKF
jgi:hypothetical protein